MKLDLADPAAADGPGALPDFHVNSRTRLGSPDLHARLDDMSALLDRHIGFAHTSTDRSSGVRVQFSLQSGPTQFRSHTSAALAGNARKAQVPIAAATDKTRAFRISDLHTPFDRINAKIWFAVPSERDVRIYVDSL